MHNFLHNVFHYPLQMYTNSRLLQAVISGAGDSKFYQLPPDKENPELEIYSSIFFNVYMYTVAQYFLSQGFKSCRT